MPKGGRRKRHAQRRLARALRMGIAWRDMAVSNLRTGQPVMEVTGWAAERSGRDDARGV